MFIKATICSGPCRESQADNLWVRATSLYRMPIVTQISALGHNRLPAKSIRFQNLCSQSLRFAWIGSVLLTIQYYSSGKLLGWTGDRAAKRRRDFRCRRKNCRSRQKHCPAGAKIVDLSAKFVMPGFIDTHVHLIGGTKGLANLSSLNDAALARRSITDTQGRAQEWLSGSFSNSRV